MVVIMFNCDIENPYKIKYPKIALSVDCDHLDVKTWYCVSTDEFFGVQILPNPDPCDIITITDLSGAEHNGVLNGFSEDKSINCSGG